MPARRRIDALRRQGDAQPGGAGGQGGPADLDGTVAVAVGLDDGPHLGRSDGDPELADVVGDGVEVDLGPRPPRTVLDVATRMSHDDDELDCPGDRRRNVAGDEAGSRPQRRRRGVQPRPGGRGVERGHPAGEQGRRSIPERTSPVPAVAKRWSPAVTARTSPPGSATNVVGPLSRTTAPVVAASRRTAAKRSAPGGPPARRWNSPSCGVNTVAAGLSRTSAAAPPRTRRAPVSPSPSTTIGHGAAATTARDVLGGVRVEARGPVR